MSDRRLPFVLSLLGTGLFAISVGWRWLVYGNVIDNGYITYSQAAICMAAETDLCRLAEALCTNSHFFDIRWYAPECLWAAAALLTVALIQGGFETRTP